MEKKRKEKKKSLKNSAERKEYNELLENAIKFSRDPMESYRERGFSGESVPSWNEIKRYNRRQFSSLLQVLSLEGDGTRESPLTLKGGENLPSNFQVKGFKEHHVSLKDLRSKWLVLLNCKNVTLENCEFRGLKIWNCEEITVKGCEIDLFFLFDSYSCDFNDCEIKVVGGTNSNKGNVFRNCSLSEENKQYLLKRGVSSIIDSSVLKWLAIITMIVLANLLTQYFLSGEIPLAYILVALSVGCALAYTYSITRKAEKKRESHQLNQFF